MSDQARSASSWASTPTSSPTSPSILDGLGRLQGTFSFRGDRRRHRRAARLDRGARLTATSPASRAPAATATSSPAPCRAAGLTVFEVNRPDRANRRRKGKSDPVDAEAAARAVLSGQATAIPKNREGAVEALRALTIARNSAVKATTTASNQIKALLVGADQELRDRILRVQSLLAARHPLQPPRTRSTASTLALRQPRPALAAPARGDPRARRA